MIEKVSIKLRFLIGLSILISLLLFFDLKNILSEISSIDSRWVIFAAVSIVVSTILGAISMFLIVSRDGQLSFKKFLPIYWASWAVGLVVPGQIGDLASISILLRRWGFDWSIIIARSLVDKIITFLIMTIIALYGLTLIEYQYLKVFNIVALVVLSLFILIILFSVCSKVNYFKRIKVSKLTSLMSSITTETVSVFYNYPLRITANSIITVIKIAFIGLAYWFVFRAFADFELSLFEVIPLMAASSLVAYLPISFNGLGTVELTGILLFSNIGLSEVTILSAFLVLRLIVYVLAWIPTVFIVIFTSKMTSNALS